MITITLPDGSQRSFEQAPTVADVAASIGSGLAKAALGGKVDGKLVDTSYLIEQDAPLSIITAKGETLDVPSRRTNDGLVAVNVIAPRFSLKQGTQKVTVYNESGGGTL